MASAGVNVGEMLVIWSSRLIWIDVQVLRWSALGFGVVYGIYHQATISASDRMHAAKESYDQKQSLISQAKAEYQRSTASPSESSNQSMFKDSN